MWNTVPMLGRYIFNSLFLATCTALITLIFVIPAHSMHDFNSHLKFFFVFITCNQYVLWSSPLNNLYKLLKVFGLLNIIKQ